MPHRIMMENFDNEVKQKFTDIDNSIVDANGLISAITADINVSDFATYGDSLNQVYSVGEVGKSKVVRVGLKGRTVVNLLGTDGNCESTAVWSTTTATSALDSTNKVFGNNSIKITTTANIGAVYPVSYDKFQVDKYYCISAYIKNIDANYGYAAFDGGYFTLQSPQKNVSDTTKFGLSFKKAKCTTLPIGGLQSFNIIVNGDTSGKSIYVDGIMLTEITAEEYNDANYVPPEYVDNAASAANVVIKVPKKNLVNGIITSAGIDWATGKSSTPGTTRILPNNGGLIKVKPSTFYTISVNTPLDYNYQEYDVNKNVIVQNVWGHAPTTFVTLQTSANTEYLFFGMKIDDSTSMNPDNYQVQLEEGNTATAYEPYQETSHVLPYGLRALNSTIYDEVKKEGQMVQRVQHNLLDGTLPWAFGTNYTGCKRVYLPNILQGITFADCILLKYNNIYLKNRGSDTGITLPDHYFLDATVPPSLYVYVSNTDSGWGDAYTPSAAEIAAYFNGWRMLEWGGLNPYNGTGTKGWVKIWCGQGVNSGGIIEGSGTQTLPTVINDQGYTPYRLYYQLATPTIIDIPPVELPVFDKGNLVVKSSTIRPIVNYEVDNSVRAIKDSALKLLGFLANKVSEVDTLVNDDLDMTVISRDANGKPTEVRYVRLDGTLYKKVVPSNVDANGNYQTITETTYKLDGATVLMTRQRTITYDANDNIDKRSKWKVI